MKIRSAFWRLFLILGLVFLMFIAFLLYSVNCIIITQHDASKLWEANQAQFGDTLEARVKTAQAIKALPGVADAGVSIDQLTVWIRYKSGVDGMLMLNPPGTM